MALCFQINAFDRSVAPAPIHHSWTHYQWIVFVCYENICGSGSVGSIFIISCLFCIFLVSADIKILLGYKLLKWTNIYKNTNQIITVKLLKLGVTCLKDIYFVLTSIMYYVYGIPETLFHSHLFPGPFSIRNLLVLVSMCPD